MNTYIKSIITSIHVFRFLSNLNDTLAALHITVLVKFQNVLRNTHRNSLFVVY